MLQELWLKCDVHPGMFSDEYSVEIENKEGRKLSFFTTKDYVKKSPSNEFLVKVGLISGNIISLPTDTFETGTSAVDVPFKNLIVS